MSAYDSIPENNAESGGVIGAQTWVSKYLLGWIPDSVNLEMFDPSTSRPFPERVQLINEYCARWGEFFDLSEYNIPTMGEIKERLNFNVARFFFNYLIISGVFFVLFTIFHLWTVIVLGAYLGVGYLLYYKHQGDIEVSETLTINQTAKNIIMIVGLIIMLGFGLPTLVLTIGCFMLFVVGVHASIREHVS